MDDVAFVQVLHLCTRFKLKFDEHCTILIMKLGKEIIEYVLYLRRNN